MNVSRNKEQPPGLPMGCYCTHPPRTSRAAHRTVLYKPDKRKATTVSIFWNLGIIITYCGFSDCVQDPQGFVSTTQPATKIIILIIMTFEKRAILSFDPSFNYTDQQTILLVIPLSAAKQNEERCERCYEPINLSIHQCAVVTNEPRGSA